MPELRSQYIATLAAQFEPLLRFDSSERFFSALAEAWLLHCANDDWSSSNKRGTAILRAEGTYSFDSGDVVGGCANQTGNRIRLERSPDPHAVGNPAYTTYDPEDLFLDFGGWDDPATNEMGSLDYLADVFSGLGNALHPNHVTVRSPITPPDFGGVPQPNEPTVYAEVEWAGTFVMLEDAQGGTRFSNSVAREHLRNYLAITYYYLYPATEQPAREQPSKTTVRKREAQWSTITVFVKGNWDGETDTGRPRYFEPSNPFHAFAVYSDGFERVDNLPPPATCRPLHQVDPARFDPADYGVQLDGQHPIAYVTGGSHRHRFHAQVGGSSDTSTHIYAENIGTSDPWVEAGSYGFGAIVVAAAVIVNPAVGLAIVILLLLANLLAPKPTTADEAVPEDPLPDGAENVAADGNGPAATPPGASTPVGSVNSVSTVLRIIDQFQVEPPVTRYPAGPGATEHPSWWDFAGRWGVRVRNEIEWDHGCRRVDKAGRSIGYWNAYHLLQFWGGHIEPELGP